MASRTDAPPQPTCPFLPPFSFLLLLSFCFPSKKPRKTSPSLSQPPHKFKYSLLKRATHSFSHSNLLGKGGFGSVYKATLKHPTRQVAVKTMDLESLQGDREFHNELLLAPLIARSEFVVHVIGFSLDRKRRSFFFSFAILFVVMVGKTFRKYSIRLFPKGMIFPTWLFRILVFSKPLEKFPDSLLERATCSISQSNLLGKGGFRSVYKATLKHSTRKVVVKTMDLESLQDDTEFHNELLLAPVIAHSEFVVHFIGFFLDRKRRLLVYDLMPHGSLQDCLFQHKSPELRVWARRFGIVMDIARGLEFLHHVCENAITHGDIKPSNILLDEDFRARIADFGLARMKFDVQQCEVSVIESGNVGRKDADENGSNREETESVTTAGLDEFAGPSQLPEMTRDPDTVATEKGSLSEGNVDMASVESGRRPKKSHSRKDWWWKQENGGEGVVKDYVMEWIGSEIKKERPRTELIRGSSSSVVKKPEVKSKKKRLDWWMAMDDEKEKKREKRRPAREWWKEEFCEELAKKKKKKKKKQGLGSVSDGYNSENLCPIDDEMYVDKSKMKKKKRSGSRSRNGSRGSMDWWLDGISGELWRARGNSHDSASCVSSTPSMRGTVCYVAPEYGRCDDLSEKCDVYSFGVLLLVLIAGRRPLQVTGSPLSEFQRANLISWSRHLARTGKLLDLVDKRIESLDQEQALLCITIALLCIQKSPSKRPSMKEVVGMLSGGLDSPRLPVEFSPSPPCRFLPKSKKGPVSY